MKFEQTYNQELPKDTITKAPAVESFSSLEKAMQIWPEEIAKNTSFIEQIKKHAELNLNLKEVTANLPTPTETLDDAIKHGHISSEHAKKLFDSLSELLANDEYKRIALYLPFEFLPDNSRDHTDKNLLQSAEQFIFIYLETWKKLLSVHDVRANFVDGDVLEVEQREGDLPRVVKAAHLIPKLVEKGLLKVPEVISLMEESDDQVLKNSIADIMPVLADLNLISEEEIAKMRNSTDLLVSSMARVIDKHPFIESGKKDEVHENINLYSVQDTIFKKYLDIDSNEYENVTKKRAEWIKQKKKQEVLEELGKKISTKIIANEISQDDFKQFLSSEANITSQQVLVEGVRLAIEALAVNDADDAKALYERFRDSLFSLWQNYNQDLKNTLSKAFRRFSNLKIIGTSEIQQLGISMPKLEGPFSENLKLMENDLKEIKRMIASIENSELSSMIYNVALVYGSRLKGYGERDADIDMAVFVKPETDISKKDEIEKLLQKTFSHEKIRDKVVQFWLKEAADGQLNILNVSEADPTIGKDYWAHILFGAAWQGDEKMISELHKKLLATYMIDSGRNIYNRNARELYLEELERDVLQYRLMHKGYDRFFSEYGKIHTQHHNGIDEESTFWDSGYRQMATKLFASRVFIPKISKL